MPYDFAWPARFHRYRPLVAWDRAVDTADRARRYNSCAARSGTATDNPCDDYAAMASSFEIRSCGAHWIYLRELPFESTDEHGVERHSDSGDCDLPDLPCARA